MSDDPPSRFAPARRPLFPGLTRRNLGTEVLAGITLLAIALPLNIGYAQIAGLPPTAGLYALVLPSLVFALLASSRHLVAAPDAAAAALVGSALSGMAVAGTDQYAAMACAQAIIGGLLFCACSVFRLGFLADFLSKPILIGFVGGLACDILLSQIAKMMGIKVDSGADFFDRLGQLISHLGAVHGWSLGLSLAVLGVLLPARKRIPTVPWALVVLVAATVASTVLHLPSHGVSVLGSVPAGPPVLAFPRLDWHLWVQVLLPALAITTVTVGEGLLLARSYADKYGYTTSPNRDLLAFGAANVASGMSGGFTIGSSTSRAAAMDQSGSRTQLPLLVMAAGALLLLVFGAGLLAGIPSPAIGAIVGASVAKLIGFGELRHLWKLSRFETAIAATCFAGVLLIGPLAGIVLAFILSLINLLRKAARPAVDVLQGSDDPRVSLTVSEDGNDETVPGVVAMRFAAPIFFGNAATLRAEIRRSVREAPHPVSAFILDMEAVSDVDVTGAEALAKELQWLQGKGITFAYSRVRPQLRANLQRMRLMQGQREFETNRAAVAALRPTPGRTRGARSAG
ncbi:SulP family inorganic anion transporter [Mycolicibacterium sp.]|uniref:SulP family inorganic anion transporter n=1 Tax=Mycolicibacterium sp. TaxID=2320850 RepID=UPI0028A7E99E|nr:SulP family inorganic anion transporter [Mycolicibacterium sp.]